MNDQKCKNKVEMWTSKLGKQYRKDEVDFKSSAKELNTIKNQPENKRCADCGTPGTLWSSVNLGVFTCMRCGSWHRALGTHISKPKGLSTYLWSPDEVQSMRDIGNAKADKLYGSSKAMAYLPPDDAPREQWLEFFRDKYERRRWAGVAEVEGCLRILSDVAKKDNNSRDEISTLKLPQQQTMRVADLLGLQNAPAEVAPRTTSQISSDDFFSQYDL